MVCSHLRRAVSAARSGCGRRFPPGTTDACVWGTRVSPGRSSAMRCCFGSSSDVGVSFVARTAGRHFGAGTRDGQRLGRGQRRFGGGAGNLVVGDRWTVRRFGALLTNGRFSGFCAGLCDGRNSVSALDWKPSSLELERLCRTTEGTALRCWAGRRASRSVMTAARFGAKRSELVAGGACSASVLRCRQVGTVRRVTDARQLRRPRERDVSAAVFKRCALRCGSGGGSGDVA